jgi:branched-subunit amino acid ABC-type transport system permease component
LALFSQAVISGLVLGAIYALMTVGMTLVFGALRTLNMAQGSYVMIAGYSVWIGLTYMHLPQWAALPLALLVAAAFAIFTELVAVRPFLARKGVDYALTAYIATLLVAMVFSSAALRIFGPFAKSVPQLASGGIDLPSGIVVTWQSIIILASAVISLGALGWFVNSTRLGLSIQAVAQQFDAARLNGVQVTRVYMLTMALAGALAGLAGVLIAPLYFVAPNAGDQPMLKALIVVVLAGLGSIRGTVWAALILGGVESFVSVYLGVGWSLPVMFAIVFVVLIVRPNGLYGKPQEERL